MGHGRNHNRPLQKKERFPADAEAADHDTDRIRCCRTRQCATGDIKPQHHAEAGS